ncbi:chemotaxis-specific protein-glutamate methyltransferase CheB [Arcobacter sp. FWKO B]|uniref:chemotaxis-specific protein-glutamate methyltransferase CheB n=1 Tax=Arcobacter sp. FWKO B TaxID=2593672 RepID=UPI0018A46E39|nr:chemotaxis-specific protein-glutamate methyltransferase CheB [Arcobacter sp. FWKO B]QOG11207.1 chemotaxis-specific protein-glutamate methyltransferase CheB [Arcobacter sp. FWKO B]
MSQKVLVVDDSALIRKELGKLLEGVGFELDYAKNGQEAIDKALEFDYDVITMDINMPVLDGLSAVKEIMKKKPTPIVMVSSLTQGDADITFEALDYGAVDFVGKPGTITLKVKESGDEIICKIQAAAKIPKNRLTIRKVGNGVKATLAKKPRKIVIQSHGMVEKVVLIGSSTGGPSLIEKIATSLPEDYPYPICVVQHMPESFTAKFANRLDSISHIEVVEAKNNDILCSGKMIIGKGGYHMLFSKKASGVVNIKLGANLEKSFFVPSVDKMFFSAATTFSGIDVLAIELTGIGDDGAKGLLELKKHGALTIAESEETATIYGMPRVAYEIGATVKVLPFSKILEEIVLFGK